MNVAAVSPLDDVRRPAARLKPPCRDARFLFPNIGTKHQKTGRFVLLSDILIVLHHGAAAVDSKKTEIPHKTLAEMAEAEKPEPIGHVKLFRANVVTVGRRPRCP